MTYPIRHPIPCAVGISYPTSARCTPHCQRRLLREYNAVTITVERWYSGWPRLDSIAAYIANQRRETYTPTITYGARWKPQDGLRGDGWANGTFWGYDRR